MEEAGFYGNIEFLAISQSSSEGECIYLNLCSFAEKIIAFMENGKVDSLSARLENVLTGKEDDNPKTKERWILLDAVDSGLSIDNIIDLKCFLQMIISDFKKHGYDLYIVISANEYELANGEQCFDVNNGKYVKFDCYEDFRNFIVKSREMKDKRYK